MSYLPLSEQIVKTKGPLKAALCTREEKRIVVETVPIHQGDEEFPSAPPAGILLKARPQWNILQH